jgi:hypothetical protein
MQVVLSTQFFTAESPRIWEPGNVIPLDVSADAPVFLIKNEIVLFSGKLILYNNILMIRVTGNNGLRTGQQPSAEFPKIINFVIGDISWILKFNVKIKHGMIINLHQFVKDSIILDLMTDKEKIGTAQLCLTDERKLAAKIISINQDFAERFEDFPETKKNNLSITTDPSKILGSAALPPYVENSLNNIHEKMIKLLMSSHNDIWNTTKLTFNIKPFSEILNDFAPGPIYHIYKHNPIKTNIKKIKHPFMIIQDSKTENSLPDTELALFNERYSDWFFNRSQRIIICADEHQPESSEFGIKTLDIAIRKIWGMEAGISLQYEKISSPEELREYSHPDDLAAEFVLSQSNHRVAAFIYPFFTIEKIYGLL